MKPKFNENNELLCPCCGGEYLHQNGYEMYYRPEDGEETQVVSVYQPSSIGVDTFPSSIVNNPSPRRYGMTIEFYCENCQSGDSHHIDTFNLGIYQHKGNTVVEWVGITDQTLETWLLAKAK